MQNILCKYRFYLTTGYVRFDLYPRQFYHFAFPVIRIDESSSSFLRHPNLMALIMTVLVEKTGLIVAEEK